MKPESDDPTIALSSQRERNLPRADTKPKPPKALGLALACGVGGLLLVIAVAIVAAVRSPS